MYYKTSSAKQASATHSDNCPDYGEDYPPHLVPLIKKYMDINEEYDGSKQGKAAPPVSG
jgi:hypothetical protein